MPFSRCSLEIDTAQRQGVPVLLFNPHANPYLGPVEMEWMLDYRPLSHAKTNRQVRHVDAIAPDGTALPTQFLPTECHTDLEWRVRSCFMADIPAFGYKVYWLQSPSFPPNANPSPLQGRHPT